MGKIEYADTKRPDAKRYADVPRKGWGLYYDSLYGYIPLPIVVRRAMDLPTVQRLRWLKQLSSASLIFPGANHTRFEHSVGVFHLATRAFDDLRNKAISEAKKEWPPLNHLHKLALQLAALFHDVGHGPWSHAFDMFCEAHPSYRECRHEIMTEKLISEGVGPYQDIPEFLDDLSKSLGDDILSPRCVADIAVGRVPRGNESYLFLSQMISSEYDVDRMDYLQRDALHTGIGMEVDIWETLHAFIIDPAGRIPSRPAIKFDADQTVCIEEPRKELLFFSISMGSQIHLADLDTGCIPAGIQHKFEDNQVLFSQSAAVSSEEAGRRWRITDGDRVYLLKKESDRLDVYHGSIWGIKISATAAPAVEALLTARDLAYRRVYYQKTHRCAVAMIVVALQDISTKIKSEDDKYKLALLSDEGFLNACEEEGTPFTKDIARRIRLRKIYEPLPFEIERAALDENANRKLADLIRPKTIEEYDNYLSKLDELARNLDLPEYSKVILDARPIPISKESEYIRKYFYDESTQESKSLKELLPHLEPAIEHRGKYIDQISKILVSLPFDFIDELVQEKKRQVTHDNSRLSPDLSQEQCKMFAADIFESKIRMIAVALLDILSIEESSLKLRFLEEFEEKLTQYLVWLLNSR